MLIGVFGMGLLLLLALPAMGLASPTDVAPQTDDGGEQNETAPGEQLAGAVGVQEAELEGDLDQRAFGIQVAQAASDDDRADVLTDRLWSVSEGLEDLEERKETLEAQREAGEITEGKYRAEMAKLTARTAALSQSVNQTERATADVPAELLEERGVDAEAIQNLRDRANELTGPEVAEIARDIAGPGVGERPGAAGNATGPPANVTGAPADDHPGGANQSAGPGNQSADADQSSSDRAGGPDDDAGSDRSVGPSDDQPDDSHGADDQQSAESDGSDDQPGGSDESDDQ